MDVILLQCECQRGKFVEGLLRQANMPTAPFT